MRGRGKFGWTAVAGALLIVAAPAAGQDAARDYAIPEQELGAALRAFAVASGREVIADTDLVAALRSARVAGRYDAATALRRLLTGTGLRAEVVEEGFVIRPAVGGVPANGARPAGPDAGEVVVTGTRIRGSAPVGAPLVTIDRGQIERSGRGTVQSLLETVPSNFGGGASEQTPGTSTRGDTGLNPASGSSINLRGLGANSTLVLFDGNRPALGGTGGTFADISLIPQLAIERIELLTDGASALYGSDAVAGVVNFRFRQRFDGVESFARAATADGDFGEYQLGQLVGQHWRTGGATLAYQYSERGRLGGDERRFSTEDLRPFGGPDRRSTFAAPGNLLSATGALLAVPAGQDGRSVTAGDLVAGQPNRRDGRRTIDLLPAQRSHAIYGALEQDVTDEVSAYGRVFWARRDVDAQRVGFQPSTVSVPTTNPFYVDPIGTRRPAFVQYDFAADLGPQHYRGTASGLLGIGGVDAKVGAWRAELNGSWGRQIEETQILNAVNSVRLAAALADPNPATAFNVFGDGGDTNPATVARVRGSYDARGQYEVWTATARADGPLFRWSAGAVRLAVGYEHRRESLAFRNRYDLYSDGFAEPRVPGLPGRRDVDAVYAELLVPLAGGNAWWLPGALDLSLAGRAERYSDVGSTQNPKVGLAWRPIGQLTVRGSWGRSFRAPNFLDFAGAANAAYGTLRLADPQSPTGSSNALVLFGYGPELGPERATSWTAGLDLRDLGLRGSRLSLTWFEIDYRDRIGSAESNYATFLTRRDLYGDLVTEAPNPATVAGFYASPSFSNLLGIPVGAVERIVDARVRNLSAVRLRGLDADARLETGLLGGIGRLGASATRLFLYDERITARAPENNVLGTVGRPVKLRVRGEAGWSKDGFDGQLLVNYTDGYSNQLVTPAERVGSWTTLDATLGYRFTDASPLRGARLALAATNLLDSDPPYLAYLSPNATLGYDPEKASPVGRIVSIQLSVNW